MSSLNWLAKVLGRSPAELTKALEGSDASPTNVLFLPYLGGERTPHNDANARGVFNMCRALIPLMSDGGSIINIGSISGNVADPSMALYNASKSFVHGLTRSIAVDHGPGIRCNAICPGWIETGMLEAGFATAANPDAAMKDALARHPVRRFGKPSDIASMALWLASDESTFASGQLFTVDGGMTASSPLNPGLF